MDRASTIDNAYAITDLVILSKKNKVPPDYVVVDQSISEGGMLSFTKRYLAYSRKIPNLRWGRVVVSDVKVILPVDRLPHGYQLLQWTLDDNSKAFSSKSVLIEIDPLEGATQAVTDIVVLSSSKKDQVPSGYSQLPEINGYRICYKVSQLNKGGGGGRGGESQNAKAKKQQQQTVTNILPVAGVAGRRTVEEEIRQLEQQIQDLHAINAVVLETSENLSEDVDQLNCEENEAIRSTRKIAKDIQDLQQQIRQLQEEKGYMEEEKGYMEEENHDLHGQLQDQRMRKIKVAGEEQPHWVVRREEVEMTTEELGRGGWGVVNVAKFRGLRVAAKCLHQVIISRYNIRQFTREMSIAAKLRHPNLLLFIGATSEGELVILTELMPTSLRKELEKTELSREQVISIGRDVSCGLSYMHCWRPHPIIHRDISSSNILLEPLSNGWRAKISDYGSANFTNLATTQNPGCVVYAAPEASSPRQHSPKMDVFSLGVLLLEMCLSEFPESTATYQAAQIKRIHWPAMVSLIERCIRERPGDSPNTSDIMSVLEDM